MSDKQRVIDSLNASYNELRACNLPDEAEAVARHRDELIQAWQDEADSIEPVPRTGFVWVVLALSMLWWVLEL